MTKNLIIGIGGTGLSAIRELRRLIAERYEGGLQDPAVLSVRFLYVDTVGDAKGKNNWEVLGKDISLQVGEKVEITGDQLGPMVQNPNDYEIGKWLPPIADFVGSPGEGAKGIRPYGRLIYEYSENKKKIHTAVINARDSLNQALPHEPSWRFYMVCGLSGGTGSGMLIPLAQDLIQWKVFNRGMTNQKLRAFLVLPPLQITGRHDRYHANAFAALKELNYLGVQGTLPFSSTYLVEPVNELGNEIGLDNLPLLIAQRLFLNIQAGAAAQVIDEIMDNPHMELEQLVEGDDVRRRHANIFFSFGLSSISYPRETIARSVSLDWAAGVVSSWLQERDQPQNINQVARQDLDRLHLSRLHVNGDGDPFGNNDFPSHETELPNQVDAKVGPLGKRQLGSHGTKVRQDLETGFRQLGIDEFYQQREKDVTRAAEYAVNQVRIAVSRQVRDPQRGIRFAKEYLEELKNILEKELRPEAAARSGEPAQRQVELFQRNYGETVNTISQHEKQLVYWDKEFVRDKANLEDELKAYLKKKAGNCSGKYATAFLDLAIPKIQSFRNEIDVWRNKAQELQDKLRGRLQVSLQGRAQDARENGTVIFNMSILQNVAKEAPREVVNPAIENRLKIKLSERLERDFEDLDLFSFGELHDADAVLENTAFEYILSSESPFDIRRTTLYDRFISAYPAPDQRRELLEQTRKLSDVFVRSVPEEVARRPVHVMETKKVSIPNVIGRLTKDKQEAQEVVRQDLSSIGVAADEILATQDVERIVFVSEKQAFPIRFIETVKSLKQYYDQFSLKDALHIDKREVGRLYELFLLSDLERRSVHEAEETFLLARVQSWLIADKNQHTQKPEIRYEYEIPGKLGKKTASFGPDWDTAFGRFTQDAIAPTPPDKTFREGRSMLTEQAVALCQTAKRDPLIWDALFVSMRSYLDGTLQIYPGRTQDPRYQRDVEIVNRIVDQHNE